MTFKTNSYHVKISNRHSSWIGENRMSEISINTTQLR
jgi:hypothetical protein